MVVADGVGSWIQLGIDPKQHSKALCQRFIEISLIRMKIISQAYINIFFLSFQDLWEKNSDLYQNSAKKLFTEAAEKTIVSGSR